jgi:hypothetical protein
MSTVVALLIASYLLIDAVPGFSILLALSVLSAIYGLFNPGFGISRARGFGAKTNVS